MDTLQSYRLIKQQSKQYIDNRHLYVASIIRNLFTPLEHKYLCEIAAGKLELASILARSYEKIDAYEMQPQSKSKISNLKVYGSFGKYVDVKNYHLLVSVCPYYYAYDIYDETDTEKESQSLVTDILDSSIENRINSFIILSDTYELNNFAEEIRNKNRYKELVHDDIDLHYERDGQKKISNNKVLIYRR